MADEMTRSILTLKSYDTLQELLLDKGLASLGDAYVNFVYSLATSQKHGHPTGAKVNNQVLAEAVEKSGLRKFLPHRVDKHTRGNAAEALLIFAWLQDAHQLENCIKTLGIAEDDPAQAFAILLHSTMRRLGVEHEQK